MIKLIWTVMRDGPFVLGGNYRWRPHGAKVEVVGPVDVGKGVSVFIAASPIDGKIVIAEAETGAIVADSIEVAKADMEQADAAVVAGQIEQAREAAKTMVLLEPDDFWKRYAGAKA